MGLLQAFLLHKQRMVQVQAEMFEVIMEKIANGWGEGLGLGSAFLAGTLDKKIEACKFDQVIRIIKFAISEQENAKQRARDEQTAQIAAAMMPARAAYGVSSHRRGSGDSEEEALGASAGLGRAGAGGGGMRVAPPKQEGGASLKLVSQLSSRWLKKSRSPKKSRSSQGRRGRRKSILLAGMVVSADASGGGTGGVDANFESFSGYATASRGCMWSFRGEHVGLTSRPRAGTLH